MKYDFTTVLDRHGKDSLAFDKIPFDGVKPNEGFDTIPMWIADMSFVAAPPAMEAILKRMEMPNFGYFALPDEYFDSIINWQRTRNGVEGLLPEHIGYENGVLGGVSSAVQSFTSPGDKILIHSPTYVGFTHTMDDTGRVIVHSELKRDEQGIWRMDYEDMDRKIKENNIHFAIFCSPHNPCGRVWERWELEQAMELFRKHDVMVVSDEIWSDLTMPGYQHIPTQSISEDAKLRTIALYAPSKTFNLAGLVGSYHVIYNKLLRDRVDKESSLSHYDEMNVLSMHALIGAYSEEGRAWLTELREVLQSNIDYVCDFLEAQLPGVTCSKPQGTYMVFVDCTQYCAAHDLTMDTILKRGWDVGVGWQDGRPFHGAHHIRLNLALPHALVIEACKRMKQSVFCD